MMHTRTLALCSVGIVCSTLAIGGQGLSRYRDFELGSGVTAVAALAGIDASEAKTIHQRPAVMQELEWRPSRWTPGTAVASTDPVEHILFSFCDDRLFRVVVDYARERTEGMTAADMTEAITSVYGTPLPRTSRPTGRAPSQFETESGSPVARWGDSDHTIVLYQTSSYGTTFRLVVTDTGLESLARKADTQARRLDDQEGPAREIARQKKDVDDKHAATAKARAANKAGFRP